MYKFLISMIKFEHNIVGLRLLEGILIFYISHMMILKNYYHVRMSFYWKFYLLSANVKSKTDDKSQYDGKIIFFIRHFFLK